jgi:hypothetical protein
LLLPNFTCCPFSLILNASVRISLDLIWYIIKPCNFHFLHCRLRDSIIEMFSQRTVAWPVETCAV